MTPNDTRARHDKQSKAAPFDLGTEAAENFANKLVSLREHSLQKTTSLSDNGAGREHSMNSLPDVTRELLPDQMVPERAIALAVAGGWKSKSSQFSADIALSLTFWTSLGKSLAWKGTECFRNARRFHGLVEKGGDTKNFWQELLPTKEWNNVALNHSSPRCLQARPWWPGVLPPGARACHQVGRRRDSIRLARRTL